MPSVEQAVLKNSELQNPFLYRKNLTQNSFPQICESPTRQPKTHKQKEHVPGVRLRFRSSHPYPVEKSICELSCRAQGKDSFLAKEGEMNTCVDSCGKEPVGIYPSI
jgi:hypothetical protein